MVHSSPFVWVNSCISGIGVTININNIIVHVLVFMDASIIILVSIGELIRILSELNSLIGALASLFMVLFGLLNFLMLLLSNLLSFLVMFL